MFHFKKINMGSQLALFEEEVKPLTIHKTTGYIFPWYWHRASDDNRKMKDKYSPWQMKLWNYLKKKKALEHSPNFNHYHTSGQLHVGGCGMSECPQKLISAYCKATYKQTWWNFRHKSRGEIKWEKLDVITKIYFREHYTFNFSWHKFKPMDTHFLFTCWYAREK